MQLLTARRINTTIWRRCLERDHLDDALPYSSRVRTAIQSCAYQLATAPLSSSDCGGFTGIVHPALVSMGRREGEDIRQDVMRLCRPSLWIVRATKLRKVLPGGSNEVLTAWGGDEFALSSQNTHLVRVRARGADGCRGGISWASAAKARSGED